MLSSPRARSNPSSAPSPSNNTTNARNHHRPTTTEIENVMISEEFFKTQSINCQSCIIPVDEENFDFFPVSFVSYLIFIIIITGFILYKLLEIEVYNNHYSSYTELDCINNMISTLISKYKTTESFLTFNLSHYNVKYENIMDYNKDDMFKSHVIDWIIMYCMIILSLWDSLFSFYRYYTTMYCAKKFILLSTKTIIKYFSIYAIPYCIIYLLQIHIYYFLWPVLILLHTVMNTWCNWMFAKILIDSTLQYASSVYFLCNLHSVLYFYKLQKKN